MSAKNLLISIFLLPLSFTASADNVTDEQIISRLNQLELTADSTSQAVREQNALIEKLIADISSLASTANSADHSISEEELFSTIETIKELKASVQAHAAEINSIGEKQTDFTRSSENKIAVISSSLNDAENNIASITAKLNTLSDKLSTSSNLEPAAENSEAASSAVSQTWPIVLGAAVLLLLILQTVLYLRSRALQRAVEDYSKNDKSQEALINALANEADKTTKLCKAVLEITELGFPGNKETGGTHIGEHDLVLSVANKTSFMETTLSKIDPKMRGYKQLVRSLAQIKDNLREKGYEIIDMLGKPYYEGMNVTADFIEDEELPEGTQIITGVRAPQVNYNGVMIQSAHITVSQNV